jgi:hypothetical protein
MDAGAVFSIALPLLFLTISEVTTQPEGARHFIGKNALRPALCQTLDCTLKATKVPGT